MSFKDLFLIFHKNDAEKELRKKITSLEKNVSELEKSLQYLKEQNQPEKDMKKEPPIIIEKINIEKIVLDKYELNNNFGQLGIKELKGKLNIGATYGSEYTPVPDEQENQGEVPTKKNTKPADEKGPRVNIQSKKD